MLDLLETQLEKNTKAIAAIEPSQMSKPTPCSRFATKDLVNHMVLANHFFAKVAAGEPPGEDPGDDMPDAIGADAAASHEASVQSLLSQLRTPGALERTFDFGFMQLPGQMALGIFLMEATIHGWDLAKATGGDTSIDPGVAEMLLQAAQGLDGMRNEEGNPFAAAVQVGDGVSPGDRLVAFTGRQP